MSRYELFDRSKLAVKSLDERDSKSDLSIMLDKAPEVSKEEYDLVKPVADEFVKAKNANAPIIIAYGAHLFKNGCSPMLISLMRKGYVQQLLTNGAGVIHDFEMSMAGKTEEDVRRYVSEGQFGLWEETGRYINEAIVTGAAQDKGLGEAVGELISTGFVGKLSLGFPNRKYSIVGSAYELNVPLSACVGIGHDIIHTHPACDGAALGKTSYTDFLIFANTVSRLQHGVMASVGSAIMAPMVFEKSLSMAKNLARTENRQLDDYSIFVNDIQPGTWDWAKGDPPKNNPAYFLRFCKSFSRMGGRFSYICMDNRKFLGTLESMLA